MQNLNFFIYLSPIFNFISSINVKIKNDILKLSILCFICSSKLSKVLHEMFVFSSKGFLYEFAWPGLGQVQDWFHRHWREDLIVYWRGRWGGATQGLYMVFFRMELNTSNVEFFWISKVYDDEVFWQEICDLIKKEEIVTFSLLSKVRGL